MSSLIIQELAFDFMHTCSRSTQDRQRNLEKHLEAERIDDQINSKSEKLKTENSVVSDYPKPPGRINTTKKPDYPTLYNTHWILSQSILQRACFQGLKICYGTGLSDAIELRRWTNIRMMYQKACFLAGFSLCWTE